MQTGVGFAVLQLSNQRIHPHTDLLLHDLGPGLADGGLEFDANDSEWHTMLFYGELASSQNKQNALLFT
ncbi:MAG: di-heme oxidoredictase family protein [Parafilimonas sp.]